MPGPETEKSDQIIVDHLTQQTTCTLSAASEDLGERMHVVCCVR